MRLVIQRSRNLKVVQPLIKDPDLAVRDAATWALTQLLL